MVDQMQNFELAFLELINKCNTKTNYMNGIHRFSVYCGDNTKLLLQKKYNCLMNKNGLLFEISYDDHYMFVWYDFLLLGEYFKKIMDLNELNLKNFIKNTIRNVLNNGKYFPKFEGESITCLML